MKERKGLDRRIGPVPAEMEMEVEEAREQLLETLADLDDDFAEVYLEEEEIPESEIHAVIRRTTLAQTFCPLLMGSAYKNKGVQDVLDAICLYLPAPHECDNQALNAKNEDEVVELRTVANAPFVGYAFKIEDHRQAGQVTYMRVYQGQVRRGSQITNMLSGGRLAVKRLVRMHSNDIKDVQTASAGDIIALAGVNCESGVTFTDGKQKVVCTSMFVPDPVMSLSVSAERADQPRFQKALRRFKREDPTFRVEVRQKTNETIMYGMGELHLEIYCERMKREYNINSLKTGEPIVNYLETITAGAPFDYTHKQQTGGRGQYGKVIGYVEPIGHDEEWDGDGIEFENRLSGQEIPPNYVPAINKGFTARALQGYLIGAPMTKMRVVLEDGLAHDVDSSEHAFMSAAAGAFEESMREALPTVLEPLMTVEVTFPGEFLSAVLHTLNSRDGAISSTRALTSDTSAVEVTVPLRKMFGYASELRSVTQGMGEFSMEFKEYEQMPTGPQEDLIAEYRKQLWQR